MSIVPHQKRSLAQPALIWICLDMRWICEKSNITSKNTVWYASYLMKHYSWSAVSYKNLIYGRDSKDNTHTPFPSDTQLF